MQGENIGKFYVSLFQVCVNYKGKNRLSNETNFNLGEIMIQNWLLKYFSLKFIGLF